MKRVLNCRRSHYLMLLATLTFAVVLLTWLHAGYQLFHEDISDQNLQKEYASVYNKMEDLRLQQYISTWNHSNRGVIIYLAHTKRVKLLIRALDELHRQFNYEFRYPVVIFHEADFQPMTETARRTGFIPERDSSTIFFQQVDLSVPDSFLRKFGQPPLLSCDKRTIGYRSMCRFHAKLLYEQPILRYFEYVWRLDDDSGINSKIEFDVFQHLKVNGYSYGFILSSIDDCAHNIYNVTMDYMRARGITPTFMDAMQPNEIFLNNFEISSTKFWLSQPYQDFIEHIDSLGGIYLHRWGDAPIKTLALRMHVPLNEIYRFKAISYSHHGNKDLFTNFLD